VDGFVITFVDNPDRTTPVTISGTVTGSGGTTAPFSVVVPPAGGGDVTLRGAEIIRLGGVWM